MATFNERDEQIISRFAPVRIFDFEKSSAYKAGVEFKVEYGMQSATRDPQDDVLTDEQYAALAAGDQYQEDPFYNVFQCPICCVVREGDDCQVCGYSDPTPLWADRLETEGWTRFECDSCGGDFTSSNPYRHFVETRSMIFCRCNWTAYRLVGPIRPS